MDVSTKNSSEKSLEKISAGKPISVYTVNFAEVINKFPGTRFLPQRKTDADEIAAQSSFSKKVFCWRNAAAVVSILAIGVLHFVFQISFIRSEVSENRPILEVPPIKIESVSAAPVETGSIKNKAKKSETLASPKNVRAAVRQRQMEPAPLKPQLKKREAVESRAARLRRAERILTGV